MKTVKDFRTVNTSVILSHSETLVVMVHMPTASHSKPINSHRLSTKEPGAYIPLTTRN